MQMLSPEEVLVSLGFARLRLPAPGGNYVSSKRTGAIMHLSGVISTDRDEVITGTAGAGCKAEEEYGAAQVRGLMQRAVLRRKLGSLERIAEVLTVNGYVNPALGFDDSSAVINGASDLLLKAFGEAGQQVRVARGVSTRPRNALAELEVTVRVKEP